MDEVKIERVDGDRGHCGNMYKFHKATFLGQIKKEQLLEGSLVLVYVKDELVGSLKMMGDRTMLGVRNVFDSKGKMVVKTGMVYQVSMDLLNYVQNERFRMEGDKKWMRFDIEELKIWPIKNLVTEKENYRDVIGPIVDKVAEILEWDS